MTNILEKIVQYKKLEVEQSKSLVSKKELESKIIESPPIRNFIGALKSKNMLGKAGIIAEIKKASPSKGIIRKDFDHKKIALNYEDGDAACLSILTDKPSFQGSPEYLRDIRGITNLPILRKDFMIDIYQVYEARSWGADCILIIMKILSDSDIMEISNISKELGMDILFEVHSKDDLERALPFKPKMIGVNNRNLEDFQTDISNSIELKKYIPEDVIVVSESGINNAKDIVYLGNYNINNFLIGESLMRSDNVCSELKKLVNKEQL